MKAVQILALFMLLSIAAADDKSSGSDSSDYSSSGARRFPPRRRSPQRSPSDRTRYRNQRGGCGGYKQGCCANSQCNYGFRCLTMGDSDWVGMARRCLPVKRRGRCGLEGLSCCSKKCIRGLTCAGGRMCRKPADSMKPPQGVTVAQLSGWVMVKVLARGGKCFVRVRGNIDTSVTTFGEGTFGETFGDLNAIGECEEGASGYAIGYIRADVLATAIRGPNGECITANNSEIQTGAQVNGEGITIGLGGAAGATVGCSRRKLTLADFLN